MKDLIQEEAFIQVMEDLQKNNEEQTTIADLVENMEKYLAGSGSLSYSHVHEKEDRRTLRRKYNYSKD